MNLISNFCEECLSKNVNKSQTVEDVIKMALDAGANNNVFGGAMILRGALVTLEEEGGCPRCINILRATINAL
jgi:hypothetical protein